MFDSCRKKNPWQNVISGGVCSDPRAWRKTHTRTLKHAHTHTHTHTHTDGGPGRAERKKGKKNRAESMLDARTGPLAKPTAAALPPLFLSNSPSLSSSFCVSLAVSRPLRVLSPNHRLSLCQQRGRPTYLAARRAQPSQCVRFKS